SVTAHAIMGLLPPGQLTATAGRVLLEGDDLLLKSPAEMRKIRGDRIAMIFQEPMTALNPVMKVGDQIAEVLDIHTGLSERQPRGGDAARPRGRAGQDGRCAAPPARRLHPHADPFGAEPVAAGA